MQTKTCKKCKTPKPKNDYYSRGIKRSTELEAVCKECRLKRSKLNYDGRKIERPCRECSTIFLPSGNYKFCSSVCQQKYADKISAKWSKDNPKRVKYLQKRWRKLKPEQALIRYRRHRLKTKYGLTLETFDALFASQNRRCALCNINTCRQWNIDHDHKCCSTTKTCGKCIRGILCNNCNTMLGHAHDSIDILKLGIKYLNKFSEKVV